MVFVLCPKTIIGNLYVLEMALPLTPKRYKMPFYPENIKRLAPKNLSPISLYPKGILPRRDTTPEGYWILPLYPEELLPFGV